MSEPSPSISKHPCSATRRDGQPCTAPALGAGLLCFAHSPAVRGAREEARRKGGRNRSNTSRARALTPPRLGPIFATLEDALAGVLSGDVDPRVATAAAAVSRALVAILQAGELEGRLRTLEEERAHA